MQDLTLDLCTNSSCAGTCTAPGLQKIAFSCFGAPGAYLCQCDTTGGYETCTSTFAGALCVLCSAAPDPALETCCIW